ncbi:alpha/beta-hydrolase [Pholiota conissans]|uniref:Alpha/beta-hydrolase n=1 Tax=Pholiota conissans TaxID=109636 RepID=A0A9P5YWN5_9AGAR|nr:alpha/beta-hydrolase [Pholiota conissans]
MPRRESDVSLSLLGILVLLHITLVGLFIFVGQPSAWYTPYRTGEGVVAAVTTDFSWETLPARKFLDWHDCFPDRQCARLIVPLDHSDPSSTQEATIALIRKPSIFPPTSKSYRGPILFNPGGPGGSGVDMVQARGDQFSTIVGPQFDIVGFDPRGIGRSTPRASFFSTAIERELWNAADSLNFVTNSSGEGVARTWARAHLLGKLAERNDDGGLRYFNTDQTARDMLSIVRAHGKEKLLYWGFSYGTSLGAVFASLFPDKVERMILDGVVDSDEYFGNEWSNNLSDANKALSSFFTSCAHAGASTCPFWAPTPDAIRTNFTRITESVRARPIPVLIPQPSELGKSTATYGLLDYPILRQAIFRSIYVPYSLFPLLAKGFAELAEGNGTLLFQRFANGGDKPPFECSCDSEEKHRWDRVMDPSVAIFCNDNPQIPGDLEWAENYFERMVHASDWADVWAGSLIACQGWPKFPKTNFRGPFGGNTSHPILFIGNTADPVTPLWGARKMSKVFNGSAVLTQDSAGHCSLSAPSLCTAKHIRLYFATGYERYGH